MSLYGTKQEKVPVVNTLSLLDYAKRKAAIELTTPEDILGGRIALTEQMRMERNAASYVELPAENTSSFAEINACKINARTGNVKLQFTLPGLPESDDDKLYLFEMATYETSHGNNYIATAGKWENGFFLFDLNQTRLYDKYVIAVKKNDTFVDISRGHYITNPEAIAQ